MIIIEKYIKYIYNYFILHLLWLEKRRIYKAAGEGEKNEDAVLVTHI